MKINFIIPFTRLSGGIRVIFLYANYLTSQGDDVVCYVPMISYPGKGQSFLYRAKASLGNSFKRQQWFKNNFIIKLVPQINNTFVRDADVTIATAWQTAEDVNKLNIKKGKKFYFIQGYEVYNGSKKQVNHSYMLKLNMITVSRELQNLVKKISGVTPLLIHNGLNNSEYVSPLFNKSSLNNKTILMMDHPEESKGSEEGIAVIKKLKKDFPTIKAIAFGRKFSHKYPDFFELYESPSRKQLLKLYQDSGIYLFTSKFDSWGLTAVEAMAGKSAVVGREIGALAELYNGHNCCLVNTQQEMYLMAKELLTNPSKLKIVQESGYTSVKNLNWKNSYQKFRKIIQSSSREV